jgi:hypothetical protein
MCPKNCSRVPALPQCSFLLPAVLTTRTGSKLGPPLTICPCRYFLRQVNTWLAFTPCVRAISATDAPGSNVCSTIFSFSSIERRWRRRTLLATTCSEVSTYPSSGHFLRCPLAASSLNTPPPSTRSKNDAYGERTVAVSAMYIQILRINLFQISFVGDASYCNGQIAVRTDKQERMHITRGHGGLVAPLVWLGRDRGSLTKTCLRWYDAGLQLNIPSPIERQLRSKVFRIHLCE